MLYMFIGCFIPKIDKSDTANPKSVGLLNSTFCLTERRNDESVYKYDYSIMCNAGELYCMYLY